MGSNLCLWFFLAVTASAQPLPQLAPAVVKPVTNTYHLTWAWNGSLTNRYAVFLNSNAVTVRYVETTNLGCTFSNLVKGPSWTAELYAVGNGVGVSWFYTNYARALFSTNVSGPWTELSQTTWPYPPPTGFLRWTNFDNQFWSKD